MRQAMILAMFLLLVPTAFASLDDLETLAAQAAGKELPGAVKAFFGSESINIEITLSEGNTQTIHVEIVDGVVGSLATGALEEPTMLGWVDEETLRSILDSDDQVQAFFDAVDAKTVRYEAVSFLGKIKVGLGSFIVGLFF